MSGETKHTAGADAVLERIAGSSLARLAEKARATLARTK